MTEEEAAKVVKAAADETRAELQTMAADNESALGNVASALLAFADSTDKERRARRRTDILLAIGIVILLMISAISWFQREDTANIVKRIDDCIGTNHDTPCRRQAAVDQIPLLANVALVDACSSLYAQGQRPKSCLEIDSLLDRLDTGNNPFLPTR